jgi:hypothetical protein
MALNIKHTLTRNESRDAVLAGKYANLRLWGYASNMQDGIQWSSVKDAIGSGDSDKSAWSQYGAACYYFGEKLSDELAAAAPDGIAPPIGLVHTAFGGSEVGAWMSPDASKKCAEYGVPPYGAQWFNERVLQFTSMTLAGWVWYQASCACAPRNTTQQHSS